MIVLILGFVGLALGSFVNACVWRLHEQSKRKKKQPELSILKGRSMCPHCKHSLGAKDLIPLLSWVELRGKCRYCQKQISYQYPLVELLTAILFVTSYLWWPYGVGTSAKILFGVWLITLVMFMILIIYDLRWMLLPNKIVYPLILLVFAGVLAQFGLTRDVSVLTDAFWGVVCTSGLFYGLFQISKGKWIGGGDVKLAIALGLLVGGPVMACLLLFVASVLGVLVTLPSLLLGKRSYTSKIPFGPFLMIGCIVVFLFGQQLVDFYTVRILGL